jgi:spoIIIJ-associated protein
MYDPHSEPHEFMATTAREAVAKACEFFRLREEELTVHTLESARVSGLGPRALIVAQPTASVGRAPARSPRETDRGRERGREREPRRGGRDGRERERRNGRERPAPAVEAPREPSVGSVRGEVGPVGEFVAGMLERMELGPFEIQESEDDDFLIYQLTGPGAQALAAGEGRTTDAVQLLANQVAARVLEEPRRVVVDAEGDRENREAFLARAAERAAQRARETGRAVALDPMNGKDRRSIHVALRDAEDVATMSIGEGRYRQVLVVPEGAAEYEEARRYAAAAAEG